MSIFNEAFQTLNLIESETFKVDDKDNSEKLKKFFDGDNIDDGDIDIVDIDADDEKDIKDSYVGDILIQCPSCMTLFPKKSDELVKSETDETLVNEDDECPICASMNGFKIVGKICAFESTNVDVVEKDDETSEDEDKTDEKADKVEEGLITNAIGNMISNSNTKRLTNGIDNLGKVVDSIGNVAGNAIDKVKDITGIDLKSDNVEEAMKPENVDDNKVITHALRNTRYNYDSHEYTGAIPKEDKGVLAKHGIDKSELTRMRNFVGRSRQTPHEKGGKSAWADDSRLMNRGSYKYGHRHTYPSEFDKIDWVDYKQKHSNRVNGDYSERSVDSERDVQNTRLQRPMNELKGMLHSRKSFERNLNDTKTKLDRRETDAKYAYDNAQKIYDDELASIKAARNNIENGNNGDVKQINFYNSQIDKLLKRKPKTEDFEATNSDKLNKSIADKKRRHIKVDKNNFDSPNYVAPHKIPSNDNETLEEDVKNVNIETDSETITVSNKTDATKEMIAPVDTEDIANIPTQAELDAEEGVVPAEPTGLENVEDADVEDFDDEAFNSMGESLLRKSYDNVESFKTTGHKIDGNKVVVEGVIKFTNGNEHKTHFVFESRNKRDGKYILNGTNANLTESKHPFALSTTIKDKKMIAESLTWNFKATDEKGNVKRLHGIKRSK